MFEMLRLPGGWLGALSLIATVIGSIGVGGMLKALLDHRLKFRKQTDDMATAIVNNMTQRMAAVERHGRVCEANLAFLRHRQNNIAGCLDATLLLMEMAPEKSSELIERVKQMRATQVLAEATERAALMAAAIDPDVPLPEDESPEGPVVTP